jgi:hypothetical protein
VGAGRNRAPQNFSSGHRQVSVPSSPAKRSFPAIEQIVNGDRPQVRPWTAGHSQSTLGKWAKVCSPGLAAWLGIQNGLCWPSLKDGVCACLTCGWAAFGDLEKRTGFSSSLSSCWLAALCLPRRPAHSQPAIVLRRPRRATGPRSSGPSTRSTPRMRMSELERSTRRGPSPRSTPRVRISELERHAHRAQTRALGRGHAPARVRSHGRFWERSLLSPWPR